MVDFEKIPKVPAFLSWLYPYKRKGLSVNTQSPAAYYLFQNKITLVMANWLFQGMRSMGTADLFGKVLLEIILFGFFFLIINGSTLYRIVIAFIGAHTINWLVNAHFWDVGRFIGITRTPQARFFPYIKKVMTRVEKDHSVNSIIVIGGVARNEGFKETSDVDMIFISRKGYRNTFCSVVVTIRERFHAFFGKFPLHLELYDNLKNIKHKTEEIPILLKDEGALVKDWYERSNRATATLDEYEKK